MENIEFNKGEEFREVIYINIRFFILYFIILASIIAILFV